MSVKNTLLALNANFAEKLNAKGVEASANEPYESLIDKVDSIQAGGGKYEELYNLVTNNGKDFSYLFYNNTEMTEAPELDTSQGETFISMFHGCSNLKSIPNYDLSKARNLTKTFANCKELTLDSDLVLDLPNVESLGDDTSGGLFYGCSNLLANISDSKSVNIKLNTPNCKKFGGVFQSTSTWGFKPLERIDIDTSNGEYFYGCFNGCKVKTIGTLDVRNGKTFGFWLANIVELTKIEKVICGAVNPFSSSNYTSTCNTMESLTIEGTLNGTTYLNKWNLNTESVQSVINALADNTGGTAATLNLSATSKALLTDEMIAQATNKNWTIA